jgi:hypothetical protein
LGANGNPTFYRLMELFSGDPTGNFGALMSMMNTYCKDPETRDTYRVCTSSSTRSAKLLAPANINAVCLNYYRYHHSFNH